MATVTCAFCGKEFDDSRPMIRKKLTPRNLPYQIEICPHCEATSAERLLWFISMLFQKIVSFFKLRVKSSRKLNSVSADDCYSIDQVQVTTKFVLQCLSCGQSFDPLRAARMPVLLETLVQAEVLICPHCGGQASYPGGPIGRFSSLSGRLPDTLEIDEETIH